MMAERFTTFEFTVPLPKSERRADWVHCPKCCAAFHIRDDRGAKNGVGVGSGSPAAIGSDGALLPVASSADAAAAATTPAAKARATQKQKLGVAGGPAALVNALVQLAALHAAGALNGDEFRAAKRKLLSV